MFQPARTWAQLVPLAAGRAGPWVLLRRPLLALLVTACMVSLLTVGSLSARLILTSLAAWAFLPLLQVLSLAAVGRRDGISFPAAVDLFFTGYGPCLLWLVALAAFWSSVAVFSDLAFELWACSLCVVCAWSWYVDLSLFRRISPHPVRGLLLQRALSWVSIFAVFAGGSLWSDLAGLVRP